MFPFEIITMLGSTLLSSVLSLWSQRMKAKQDEQKMLITRGEFQLKAVESARNVQDKGFQWTRRIIALTSVPKESKSVSKASACNIFLGNPSKIKPFESRFLATSALSISIVT